VARNILLAELTGVSVHCQHLSAAGSVKLLREAKKRGLPISGEACPHHFTLTDAAVAGSEKFWPRMEKACSRPSTSTLDPPSWPAYDTNFKMNPPLRSARDREAILEGLADGTIEILASDHAPHCNSRRKWNLITRPSASPVWRRTGAGADAALSCQTPRPFGSHRQIHRRTGEIAAAGKGNVERGRRRGRYGV